MSLSEDTDTKQPTAKGDTKPSWHQLLIIGNGFDLECGLKSSFGHFIATKRKLLAPSGTLYSGTDEYTWRETVTKTDCTVWDLFLKEQREENWCDIEAEILEQIKYLNARFSELTYINQYISERSNDLASYDFEHLYRFKLSYDIYQYISLRENGSTLSSEKNFNLFILKELHRFEDAFSEYLREQIIGDISADHADKKDHPENLYTTAAKTKLHTLLSFGLQSDNRQSKTFSILSFNYTGPFDISPDEIGQRIAYTNIHGICSEGEEIIFGIDGKENLENEITRPFTKTYRLLGLGGPQAHDVVSANTRCIKFYGHSLSDADYSYFQAIFDAVHLYSSDVSLVFFYRCFDEKDPLSHRSEMTNKVINLLTAYGATLENKDHGKNLIHKLLLEGRLSVEEIRFDSQSDN